MRLILLLTTLAETILIANAAASTPFALQVEVFTEQNEGAFCWKRTYGRGVGTIPKGCGDKQNQAGLCYTPCKADYDAVGPLCWAECRSGFRDDGATCFKSLFNFYFKDTYGRGAGTIPKQCDRNEENDAGLCYDKCKDGFEGIGPVCWRRCEGDTPVNCGLACASSRSACVSKVFEQIVSVLQLAEGIVELVVTLGGSSAIKASAKAAMNALYQTARGAVLKGASKADFILLMKKMALKAGKQFSQAAAETAYVKAAANTGFSFEDFAALDPTGIADVVLAFTSEVC